jgi:hypothetical protein
MLVFLPAGFVPAQSEITAEMLFRRASPSGKNPAHDSVDYFWLHSRVMRPCVAS